MQQENERLLREKEAIASQMKNPDEAAIKTSAEN